MNPFTTYWNGAAGNGSQPGWSKRRVHPEAPSDIFAALHHPDGMPALILSTSVDIEHDLGRLPDCKGFKVQPLPRTNGGPHSYVLQLLDRVEVSIAADQGKAMLDRGRGDPEIVVRNGATLGTKAVLEP